MEVIKQHEYLLDGTPAGKAGEWPGIKPNHWKGSVRVIRPHTTGIIIDGIHSYNIDGVVVPELTRRHYTHRPTDEMVHKPMIKVFPELAYKVSIEAKYIILIKTKGCEENKLPS
jgi:hypothetical protein